MKSRCLVLPSALLAFACLALPAPADSPARPSNLRSDILYTHRGEFVQVSPMRPLTLNAHVEQFAYDPLGLEIAYVGSEPQGENTVHFVKTVDARTGHEISRLTEAQGEPQGYDFTLLGWSVSGKYLLLTSYVDNPQDTELEPLRQYLRWDLSASPPTFRVISPPVALTPSGQPADSSPSGDISPNKRWILFRQNLSTLEVDGKAGKNKIAYLLYDPERDISQPITLPPGMHVYSWTDDNHLAFWQEHVRKQFDVITSQVSSLTTFSTANTPAASKQYPDLTLDTKQRRLEDTKGSGSYLNAWIIWIRRTDFGKTPLEAVAAGLTPSSEASDSGGGDPLDLPQAAWSPTGKQVAFIAHGDLYVADLTAATDLIPREKMAVGLSLTCAEEKSLAQSDLKQIGLSIVQYNQNNDENFPMADGFIGKVYPYLKKMDVFQVGSHKFVYEQPADLSLRNMESPATTELGFMDLPCARAVLFADGHVRDFAK